MARQRQIGRTGLGHGLRRGLLILIIALLGDSRTLWAQTRVPTLPMAAVGAVAAPESESVRLVAGRSTVVDVGSPIARVSLTSADIADVLVTGPSQLLINGKLAGTISMFVWDRSGAIRRYEVTVQRDLSRLNEQMHQLFPNDAISAQSSGKAIVLSGAAMSQASIDKALELAAGYADKKDDVVNMMKLQENAASNQVLLRVRFAEVSRSAMTELGISGAANGYNNGRWFGRVGTEQFAEPSWDNQGRFVFSDFLNLFLFDSKNQLAGVIRALQTKGLFQSLAEPNLVAESGKEASFLAGGEFPVPIAQPSGSNIAITIIFKEFGVRLNFTPTINGERVNLRVRPEVSTLDFTNAITLQGFRIPALSTRRTETEVELANGQTFAIAGLLNNTMTQSLQKIPGIGDIPILGLLFRSKAAQKDQTELVVMITPEILPRNSYGLTDKLPRTPDSFIQPLPDKKTLPPQPPAFQPSRPGGDASIQMQSVKPTATASGTASPRPIQPTPATAAGPGAAQPAPSRPLTAAEQKTLERARRDEQSKAQGGNAAQTRAMQQQAEQDRIRVAKERAEQERLAKENAKRDAEQAKIKAEAARKQAEIDKKQQKAIEEAAAKLKAAEAAYQAEVAKKNGSKDKDKQDK